LNQPLLVEWSHRSLGDLEDRVEFLSDNSVPAAERAAEAILSAGNRLGDFPQIGRPYAKAPDQYRELVVPFGSEGYTLLYEVLADRVFIVGLKHQREAGY